MARDSSAQFPFTVYDDSASVAELKPLRAKEADHYVQDETRLGLSQPI